MLRNVSAEVSPKKKVACPECEGRPNLLRGGMLDRPFEAYRGDEPYLFICYAHDDQAVVYPEINRDRRDHERSFEHKSPLERRREIVSPLDDCIGDGCRDSTQPKHLALVAAQRVSPWQQACSVMPGTDPSTLRLSSPLRITTTNPLSPSVLSR